MKITSLSFGQSNSFFFFVSGHADPTSVTNSLIAGAKMRGERVVERCPDVGLEQTPDKKWKVKTEQGTIIADRVVNAAGLWGQQVARMAGVSMSVMIYCFMSFYEKIVYFLQQI